MKRMFVLAAAAVLTLTGCDLGLPAEPAPDDGPPDAVVGKSKWGVEPSSTVVVTQVLPDGRTVACVWAERGCPQRYGRRTLVRLGERQVTAEQASPA